MTSKKQKIIDPMLMEIIICPVSKEELVLDSQNKELISKAAKLAYPIKDGIPILLPEEARKLNSR